MVKLTNGEVITEYEYIERLETRLDETEKELEEIKVILEKIIKGGK